MTSGGAVGSEKAWSLWIDTGGTFTDCLGIAPDGRRLRAKVLSSASLRGRVERIDGRRLFLALPYRLPAGFFEGCELRRVGADSGSTVASWLPEEAAVELAGPLPPELGAGAQVELAANEEAAVLAARLVTGTPPGRPLPPAAVRLATTRGTNALLERRGTPTALFVTHGFADLLEIGDQRRPDLFTLEIAKPPPLVAAVVEVDERLAADGTVLRPLAADGLEGAARELLERGITAAAVALVHGYLNPAHERAVGAILARAGFAHVALSSDLAPRIKLLPRARTAVVDAYLSDAVAGFVGAVGAALGDAGPASSLRLMTSAGGLAAASSYRPKDSLLSGPAAGVVGAMAAGRASGRERLLCFDMGGTSTDVARWAGELEYREETVVGDARLASPSLAVEAVAAGGGSICRFDGERLRVGPESAGARPGPACYGLGGPLTLTDVNLLLGRIDAARFPFPPDRGAAAAAARRIVAAVAASRPGGAARTAGGGPPGALEPAAARLLAGFVEIANELMAAAVRRISLRRGYRAADHALVAFGGAGGQHACALAELLGIGTVIVPAEAALLSARGLGRAAIERLVVSQVLRPLDTCGDGLAGRLSELAAEALRSLAAEGVDPATVEIRRREAMVRLAGQESTLALPWTGEAEALAAAFTAAYEEHFGYRPPPLPLEVESLRVVAASPAGAVAWRPVSRPPGRGRADGERRPVWAGGSWRRAAVRERGSLGRAESVAGPALVVEEHSVTVVEPGWRVAVDAAGALVLERREGTP